MNIAIQGIQGSFHHIAANAYFGKDIKLTECLSFDEMPNLLIQNKADYLIMAIENSIAGAILANYKLIDECNLTIVGELYLPIQHQLMALKNQTLKDITEVWSHPMAINQCRSFLREQSHIKLIEENDTAEVAKRIQEKKLVGIAAIASIKASEIYNLEILANNIQTNTENYTRFFILKKEKEVLKTFNKMSLKFITKHQQGSLAEVLQLFVKHELNLSKIQSLPIIDAPWKYAFFADVVFENENQIHAALIEMKNIVSELKVLGSYSQANWNTNQNK